MPYVGRFAPSPTGPLHAGSLVAALASWLDARAHGGRWLVRIEDVDTPRCMPGADAEILRQLASLGLHSDAPVQWQSRRAALYEDALRGLVGTGRAYACACTRQQIALRQAQLGHVAQRHIERPYPGTCRPENGGLQGRAPRAWRLRVDYSAVTVWQDRRLGTQSQNVGQTVGDFVLRRADGLWAYQLAVVVDDAEQGVTHVVRGEDLADNTARQLVLQQALGLPAQHYLHVPLVRDAQGEKLSKQRGAAAIDTRDPGRALQQAAVHLQLAHGPWDTEAADRSLSDRLAVWTARWAERWAKHHEQALAAPLRGTS